MLLLFKSEISRIFAGSEQWQKRTGEEAMKLCCAPLKPENTFVSLHLIESEVRIAIDRTLCVIFPDQTKTIKKKGTNSVQQTTIPIPTIDVSMSIEEAIVLMMNRGTGLSHQNEQSIAD